MSPILQRNSIIFREYNLTLLESCFKHFFSILIRLVALSYSVYYHLYVELLYLISLCALDLLITQVSFDIDGPVLRRLILAQLQHRRIIYAINFWTWRLLNLIDYLGFFYISHTFKVFIDLLFCAFPKRNWLKVSEFLLGLTFSLPHFNF